MLIFLYIVCGLAYGVLIWKKLEDRETDANKMVIIFLYALFGPCALVYEALKVLEDKVYEESNSRIRFK